MKVLWLFIFSCALWSCFATRHSDDAITKGYIPVKDSKIYYETVGQGYPIILLHAGFLDRNMWLEQVKELKKN